MFLHRKIGSLFSAHAPAKPVPVTDTTYGPATGESRGALHSSVRPAQFILPVTKKPALAPGVDIAYRGHAAVPPPEWTASPEALHFGRLRLTRDFRILRKHVSRLDIPSALSSLPCVRHHPKTRKRVPTALQELPLGLSADFLLRPHSPSTVFQAPGLPNPAPGTNPATAEAPALAMSFPQRVTSLSQRYPAGPAPYARLFQARHRFH